MLDATSLRAKSDAELDAMPLNLRVAWLEAYARDDLLADANAHWKTALRVLNTGGSS